MVFLCAMITFYSHTPYIDIFFTSQNMSVGAFRGALMALYDTYLAKWFVCGGGRKAARMFYALQAR